MVHFDPATVRVLASGLLVLGIAFALLRWLQARGDRGVGIPARAVSPARHGPSGAWTAAHPAATLDRQRDRAGPPKPKADGIVVKEAESELDRAEVFLSVGMDAKAAEALDHEVRTRPDQAIGPWMRLLTLYRKSNRRGDFVDASARLRSTYNIRFPASPEGHTAPAPATIEAYPHILKRLANTWDTPNCLAEIDRLMHDSRGGHREGFPPPVIEELELLAAVLAIRLRDEEAGR